MRPTVRRFAPDYWGELEKFTNFYGNTYNFDSHTRKAVAGALNHFKKAITLRNLAHKIRPNLEIDQLELKENGFTPTRNSYELSAVIETVFLELYSSIDCTRKVIETIYKNYRGIPSSTRKLFANATEDKIDPNVPEPIRSTLSNADWYPELRKIRDELTHANTGTCHLNKETDKVFYMHSGLGGPTKSLVIEDIFEKLDALSNAVNFFLGAIFRFLNSQLSDDEMWQLCGVFEGRIYSRFVSPKDATDFNSGRCDAYKWFEIEENPTCPFVDTCEAYKKVKY